MADRSEPFIAPYFGNARGFTGDRTSPGSAVNDVLPGANYGFLTQTRSAVGATVRNDGASLTRLPVAQARPIWQRFNIIGAKLASTAPNLLAGAGPSASPHPPDCACKYETTGAR